MTNNRRDYQTLISAAYDQHEIATLAFAGVISTQSSRKPPYDARRSIKVL
jgi:hypothetical protein